MKRILFLLLTAGSAASALAQTTVPNHTHVVVPQPKYNADSMLAGWVIDVNLLGGALTQDMTFKQSAANFTDGVNMNTGSLKFTNGVTLGAEAQVGYFFGVKRHWGIGIGFQYLYQQGDATLDNFHAEYRAIDGRGDTYRQIVSSNGKIKEELQMTNLNIPLVAKYKTRFSRLLGFTADAGLLFNVQMRNTYKTNASFDYEAAYLHDNEANTFVYDNNPAFNVNDVLYTKAQLSQTLPAGSNMGQYFDFLRNTLGYNVGLNQKPPVDHGAVEYKNMSVGFIIRPQLSFFLSDNVALNVGFFYIYQNFSNDAQNGYRLTGGTGDYTSVLKNVSSVASQSYGGNIGLRFFLGRKGPMVMDEDAYAPSWCGLSDGKIALNGVHINEGDSVLVDYQANGVQASTVRTVADSDGIVYINNLPAGTYDSIHITTRKRHANGAAITIADQPMSISFESTSNPTAYDRNDGTLTLIIPRPGQTVTINYSVNGTPKTFTGVIGSNGRIVVTGLGGGNYTNITAVMGKCSASAVDVTLVAPAPPPPPPPPPPPAPAITVSTPILFEVNKTIIREDSHPIIELAVEKLNADKDAIVVVNGYTDATGRPAYNKALSMRRANAVKKELMSRGISAKRIKVVGHGSSEPADTNDTAEGRAKNRRAVMHLNVGE